MYNLITNVYVCIPCDFDGVLDTLMGRTAFRMHSKRSFSRFERLRWYSQVIMNSYGLNTDGLANTDDAPIDGCSIRVPIKTNLSPCQGTGKCAVHSASAA